MATKLQHFVAEQWRSSASELCAPYNNT